MSTGFSTQDITSMLGLSPARLRAYVKAGVLCPQRGQAGELRFSFQDLLLLRTAEGLVTKRLPPRRVRDALRKLRRRLPDEQPLTGVHLANEDGHVVVRDGGATWRADSGQILLAFADPEAPRAARDGQGDDDAGPEIATLHRPPAVPPAGAVARAAIDGADGDDVGGAPAPQPAAEDFYQLGCNLEDGAPDAARVAYQRALELDPRHADAHVNLGRLLHELDEWEPAEAHYRAALALRPDDITALFNLGVLLEDRERADAAIDLYEAVLTVDPTHADAHFNAARLHDLAGHYEAALRHLRAYRNLTTG